jgi:hypothetical protein
MDPKNRKAFEDYVAHKGIAIDSPEFSQLVKDMGFDGIRYFDTYATGEEFVLFDTTKLVKYDAAEQAAAEKAAITAEKTAYYQGLAAKKIKEAEKLGVTGPEMDELKAVIGDSKYTYSQIKGKIDKLNPVTNAAKAAQKTIDPLSDQALLKQFTQEEVDKLHEAHATFLNKISWMDLDGQITKVDFEINWLLKNGKYSTSSTLSKMLEKDLAALQVQKKYEATKNGAQTMVSLYKSKGDASLTASIKKLEAKLAKNVPIAELEQAIDDASLAVQSYNSKVAIAQATANAKAAAKQATANAKKAAGMNTAATEDITFYEDETDPFSLTKFYTPAEKAEVQRLRLELQNAIVKDNGSIRTWKVRDASDELTKKLEELGTKYHTKQKSWQHIGIETKGGVSKAVKLTDSQAKSAYDKYTGLPSTGKNYFNHGGPIGGKFVGEQDVMDRTKRYVERINQAGGKINETMVGVPGRYCRGSGFINNYILGHDTKPPSDVMAALDSYTGALSHALNMMPRYNGVTYRGSSYVDSMWKDIMEAQKNGKPFTNIAVMSTATEVSRADSFEKAITFKIYGRSGVRVDDFSHFKGEKEVLFRPGTKFEIIDVYKAKGDNDIANDGQWTVIMREILE